MLAREPGSPSETALVWLYQHVVERFGCPVFGQDPRFVVQAHLDKDCLRPVKKAYPDLLKALTRAIPTVLETGQPASFDLVLTPVVAGGDPIPLTVTLGKRGLLGVLVAEARALGRAASPDLWAGLAQSVKVRSLCLEIGADTATVKAVLGRDEAINSDLVVMADKAEVRARKTLAAAERKAVKNPADEILATRDRARAALDRAVALAVDRRRRFAETLATRCAVIGVDPGQRDAVAASILRIEGGVEAQRALDLGAFDKHEMHRFLSTHALPEPVVTGCMSLQNKRFLDLMAAIGQRIDSLSRALDARFRRIGTLKRRINAVLRHAPDRRVPEAFADLDLAGLGEAGIRDLEAWHGALFRELAKAAGLKAARLAQWTRIRAIKRSWFGLIGNRICVLALETGAGVALENGDWGIERKESKNYQGRTRNRVMASVSPRKLLDVIRDKLDWSGVVWWNVSSYYTSTTDHRVAVVAGKQRRKGTKTFRALFDGLEVDADQHAGETIAATSKMVPLDAAGLQRRDAILTGSRTGSAGKRQSGARRKIADAVPTGETGLVSGFSF